MRLMISMLLLSGYVAMAIPSADAEAQITFPAIKVGETADSLAGGAVSAGVASPSHGRFAVKRKADELQATFSVLDSAPRDSLRRLVVKFAESYVPKYTNVDGLQHQPYALVAIGADDDPLGKEHFQAWMNTPALPVADQASALFAEVTANMDPKREDRLQVAEKALAQLEQLGPVYTPQVVTLHWRFIDAYYDRGDRDAMIAHGIRGLELGAREKTWERRSSLLRYMPLIDLAQAYAGLVNGAEKMEQVLNTYRAAYDVANEEREGLPQWMLNGQIPREQRRADDLVAQVRQIGKEGPPLRAHAWINAGLENRQSSPVERVNQKGNIRVVEFGYMHCGACIAALPKMQRLSQVFRDRPVEVLYLTWTVGSWDVDLVSPATEVEKLRDLYVNRMKLTFPIGVWAGDKVPNPDGGETPQDSEVNEEYNVVATPEIVVLDGAGRVRFRSHGGDERVLRRVISFLLLERDAESSKPVVPPLEPLETTASVH